MIGNKILVAAMFLMMIFAGCVLPTSEDAGSGAGKDTGNSSSGGGTGNDGQGGETKTYYSKSENVNYKSTTEKESFDVETSGELDLSVAINCNSGSLKIKITNPSGTVVYERSFSGQGQSADQRSLSGMKGRWAIEYQYTAFMGQISISING